MLGKYIPWNQHTITIASEAGIGWVKELWALLKAGIPQIWVHIPECLKWAASLSNCMGAKSQVGVYCPVLWLSWRLLTNTVIIASHRETVIDNFILQLHYSCTAQSQFTEQVTDTGDFGIDAHLRIPSLGIFWLHGTLSTRQWERHRQERQRCWCALHVNCNVYFIWVLWERERERSSNDQI